MVFVISNVSEVRLFFNLGEKIDAIKICISYDPQFCILYLLYSVIANEALLRIIRITSQLLWYSITVCFMQSICPRYFLFFFIQVWERMAAFIIRPSPCPSFFTSSWFTLYTNATSGNSCNCIEYLVSFEGTDVWQKIKSRSHSACDFCCCFCTALLECNVKMVFHHEYT